MTKKISNILIRGLSDSDREALSDLMNETRLFQASKAVMQAVYAFKRNTAIIKKQAERIRDLEYQNHILRNNSEQIVKSVGKIKEVLSKL